MKTITFLLFVCSAIIYVLSSCNITSSKPVAQDDARYSKQLIARGEYLVNAIGCDDCHSPKKMGPHGPEVDAALRFSGYPAQRPLPPADNETVQNGWALFGPDLTAAIGPWGASFAANITSDETGIGKWTEAQFIKAIREGKSKGLDGARTLLPPMPWQNFRKLNDEDLKSIYAYLKTTTPVKNIVPSPIPLKDIKFKKEVRKV
ncbi:c-type cytochrome [Ilyomonas limi]|uniref:C-type cytochrome n=1 Tax=Ilyomonas limi TaxID=2575867 RepID=A0A4U3L0W9_9BACT|nr:c-type cytochrome [Ilyomonas limi]TKK68615.1 c-type cytochrome [Ilyomonas limi]